MIHINGYMIAVNTKTQRHTRDIVSSPMEFEIKFEDDGGSDLSVYMSEEKFDAFVNSLIDMERR